MNSGRAVCAICGVALMGAAVAHVCIADIHGEERPRQVSMATPAHVHGTHDHGPEDAPVDQDVSARQIVAVGTTSEAIPPGQSMMSEDVVLQSYRRRGWHPAYDMPVSPAPWIWAAADAAKQRAIVSAIPHPSSTTLYSALARSAVNPRRRGLRPPPRARRRRPGGAARRGRDRAPATTHGRFNLRSS